MPQEMRRSAQIAVQFVTCLSLVASLWAFGGASTLQAAPTGTLFAALLQSDGKPLEGAVITVYRRGAAIASSPASASASPAAMDQMNRAFTPEVIVIPVGASVVFPNSDTVSHQVYSFSAAKRFQLPLYRGKPYPPIRFDTPGIITLGCNIHDNMIGWILVTDAPWFGRSDAQGHWTLNALATGEYDVTIWHPRLREDPELLTTRVRIEPGVDGRVSFKASKTMRPAPLPGKSREWDY
jgi:plastocyanin